VSMRYGEPPAEYRASHRLQLDLGPMLSGRTGNCTDWLGRAEVLSEDCFALAIMTWQSLWPKACKVLVA
jgi:hypothetical protein